MAEEKDDAMAGSGDDVLPDVDPLAHEPEGTAMFACHKESCVELPGPDTDSDCDDDDDEDMTTVSLDIVAGFVATAQRDTLLAKYVRLMFHMCQYGTLVEVPVRRKFITAFHALYKQGLVQSDAIPVLGVTGAAYMEVLQRVVMDNNEHEPLDEEAREALELVGLQLPARMTLAPLLSRFEDTQRTAPLELFTEAAHALGSRGGTIAAQVKGEVLVNCRGLAEQSVSVDQFLAVVQRDGVGLWLCQLPSHQVYCAIKADAGAGSYAVFVCNGGPGAQFHCRAKEGCFEGLRKVDVLVPVVVQLSKADLRQLLCKGFETVLQLYQWLQPRDCTLKTPVEELVRVSYLPQLQRNCSVYNLSLAMATLFTNRGQQSDWVSYLQDVVQLFYERALHGGEHSRDTEQQALVAAGLDHFAVHATLGWIQAEASPISFQASPCTV